VESTHSKNGEPDSDHHILIGVVGAVPVLECHPLGPALLERLGAQNWSGRSVSVEALVWGAMHVVQQFQETPNQFDRVVLVGSVQRGDAPGTVTSWRWKGGPVDIPTIQDRIFDAVTGIISLDHLVLIGEHFGVWPKELFLVEIELPETLFGEIAANYGTENGSRSIDNISFMKQLGFDPKDVIRQITDSARYAALGLFPAGDEPGFKTARALTPATPVCYNAFVGTDAS
jgi:hypothetical protein